MFRMAVVLGVLVSVLAIAGAASAPASTLGGGTTIAGAPQLPFDTYFTDGSNNTSFLLWRVPLQVGDKLTLDYGQVSDNEVDAYIYPPGVTDFNWGQTAYVARDYSSNSSNGKREFVFKATSTGNWILDMTDGDDQGQCCIGPGYSVAYQITAHDQHLTHTTLSGPASARRGSVIRVHGSITAVDHGNVTINFGFVGKKPLSSKLVPVVHGAFSWSRKLPAKPGVYRIGAIYSADGQHQASKAALTVRVR